MVDKKDDGMESQNLLQMVYLALFISYFYFLLYSSQAHEFKSPYIDAEKERKIKGKGYSNSE